MLSKACKYGIRAALYLSVYTNAEKKVGVKEIADDLNVPRPFLAKILQVLSKNDVVSSTKGPYGGFYMTKANNAVNIIKIVECIDGLESFETCILGLPICGAENPCPLHFQAAAYRDGLQLQLEHQTIAEMALRVEKGNFKI